MKANAQKTRSQRVKTDLKVDSEIDSRPSEVLDFIALFGFEKLTTYRFVKRHSDRRLRGVVLRLRELKEVLEKFRSEAARYEQEKTALGKQMEVLKAECDEWKRKYLAQEQNFIRIDQQTQEDDRRLAPRSPRSHLSFFPERMSRLGFRKNFTNSSASVTEPRLTAYFTPVASLLGISGLRPTSKPKSCRLFIC